MIASTTNAFGLSPRVARWGTRMLRVVVPVLVVALAWNELRTVDPRALSTFLMDARPPPLVLAVGLAFVAVGVMGLYDTLAFNRLDSALGPRLLRRWLIGSAIYAWTNLIGFGPAIRGLVYAHYGYRPRELARGIAVHYVGSLSGLAGWLTAMIVPGLVLGLRVALAGLLSVGLAVLVGRTVPRVQRLSRLLPGLGAQPFVRLGAVGFADWGFSALAFVATVTAITTLPDAITEHVRAVVLGWGAGVASMLPGGVGAADTIWLRQLTRLQGSADAAAAMVLAYRMVMYVLPWSLGLITLGVLARGARQRRRAALAGASGPATD